MHYFCTFQSLRMRIVIINKSDSTGGAAVVSRRLMEALRLEGIDARMLVCEKLTDSPYVDLVASPGLIKRKFISERLKIFLANGLNRKTLFKIDTGEVGLPLWNHPLVKEADAILLNWINQGMLSLEGVRKILNLGKPVVWTMHDMWCMTGICHHAGECLHFEKECGYCPLLGSKASQMDLSNKIWKRKNNLYSPHLLKKTAFVAVSRWLKGRAIESTLLREKRVEVIPNAFESCSGMNKRHGDNGKIRILFGAARLDDPIKGLDILRETSGILANEHSDLSKNLEIAFFGNVKNPEALEGFSLPVIRLGVLKGEESVARAYLESDILVSASSYETLPGTLVEAQAYGCIPVSFNQGGQSDITEHKKTGYIATYDNDKLVSARNLAEGIIWACGIIADAKRHDDIIKIMKDSVKKKFSYTQVARQYLSLINNLNGA